MEPKISIIIPCYNEKDTILAVLVKIDAAPVARKEIIVVCDGSTDGTKELLEKEEKLREKEVFHVIYNGKNMGKGASIKKGLEKVSGDIVIIQDADLELTPEDYPKLIKPFGEGHKVVFGSRFRDACPAIPLYSRIANIIVTYLANLLYNAGITDEACGYKVMTAEIYRSLKLESDGFDFCPEVTAKVCRKGYHIHEVAVQFNPRSFSEGKKIRWKHGIEAVWKLIKYRIKKID